jgi:DNA-binding transcriptional MerR regulator
VSTTYRIAEVARRSGFSPATLRYYEGIGLVPQPDRTEAGYRLYDDHALQRLAFIARAKQLGCTLEEIADLSTAWDGGRCGPVQDRLRALVAAKRSDTHDRIVELIGLATELERAATALEQHRPEGQCDDRCGCTSDPERTTSVALIGKADRVDERPALSCTLEPGRMVDRLDHWHAVLAHVEQRRPLDDGVRLELTSGVSLSELVGLVAAEHDCCRFFAFAVTVDERGIGLEVRSSAEALPIVHALFGAAA